PLALTEQRHSGHFAGLPVMLDYRPWRTRHPYMLSVPQAKVEEYLESRLPEYGVPVVRGQELTAFEQDEDGVTATLRDGRRLRGTATARPGRPGHRGGDPPRGHRRVWAGSRVGRGALVLAVHQRLPPGRALPRPPGAAGRRRRAHPPAGRRARPEPRPAGRLQ